MLNSDTPAPAHIAFRSRVLDWSDERGTGDGIIVTLAHGWAFEPSSSAESACHVRGFATVKEAQQGLRAETQPCPCPRCHPEAPTPTPEESPVTNATPAHTATVDSIYYVTCDHLHPDYRMESAPFGFHQSQEHSLGYEGADIANARGFWASAKRFGCGRTMPTPEAAIRSLLESNGCHSIKISRAVDLTPTWEGLLPMLLAAYESGTAQGRKIASEELRRMARIADAAVADQKAREAAERGQGLPNCFATGHQPDASGRACAACGQTL